MRPRDTTPILRHFLVVPLALTLIGVTGCGKSPPKTVPVGGKVFLNEKPLMKGAVTFHPDNSKGNTLKDVAVGNINGGEYTLATGAQGGAPVGWYKVTVTSSQPSNPKDEYSVPISLVPEVYTLPEKTTLTVEVKKDATAGAYDLKLSK